MENENKINGEEEDNIKGIFFAPYSFPPPMETDLEILKKHHEVDCFKFDVKKLSHLFIGIKKILQNDLVYARFGSFRTLYLVLFSKLLGKKSLILSGGYDVAKIPEIGYGSFTHPIRKYFSKISLSLANKVVAFSESGEEEISKRVPDANVETAYIGAIDTEKFKPKGEKEDIVITVGHVTKSNLKRKGHEAFVETARYLPNVKFVLIGGWSEETIKYLKSKAPDNVEFTGYLTFEELLEYYQKAKVYVQVSAHEGFGMTIAESMACECVPVVTEKYAIPEVVGDTGYYVPYEDPKATSEAIKNALKDDKKGELARERIIEKFNIEEREKKLLQIISNM